MVKAWRQNRFIYIFNHFTIRNIYSLQLKLLKNILINVCRAHEIYFFVSWSNFISHRLYCTMFLKTYYFRNFTMKPDVEVTFSHLRFSTTQNYFMQLCRSRLAIFVFLRVTFYLICLMVKSFWTCTFLYIVLCELMWKSLFHILGPYRPKYILI